jgi:hypothetical protein
MSIWRRLLPWCLLGLLALVGVTAAIFGYEDRPTSESALAASAQRTMAASSFVFHAAAYGYSDPELTSKTTLGVWQSPDRLKISNLELHRTLTFIGSTAYVPARVGYTMLNYNLFAGNPFDGRYAWVAGLPPIGLLTDVEIQAVHGDTYICTVPSVALPPRVIVYAPVSRRGVTGVTPAGSVARDTQAWVVVRDGYVVRFTFPKGIESGKSYVAPISWTLTEFGSAPTVAAPRN